MYPALARPFKNFELVCEAARILEQDSSSHAEIRITVHGDENRYAKLLKVKFGDCKSVRFIGLQSFEEMQQQYAESDCLVFPSRRETWGLPLTEAKEHGLAILAADLEYARESVGRYDGVKFFRVDDPQELAQYMLAFQK